MIKKICAVCSKSFSTYPSKLKVSRGKYCSRICSNSVTLIKKGQRISTNTEFKKGFTVPQEWKMRWKGRIPWNKDTHGLCKPNCASFQKGKHPSPQTEFHKGQFALEKHFNWKGGLSFIQYPLGWNDTFREQIRYRDGYKCRLCGKPEIENNRKLHVHHIDYNKHNLNINNLVALCNSCHLKTNYNRENWINLFTRKEVVNEYRREKAKL